MHKTHPSILIPTTYIKLAFHYLAEIFIYKNHLQKSIITDRMLISLLRINYIY